MSHPQTLPFDVDDSRSMAAANNNHPQSAINAPAANGRSSNWPHARPERNPDRLQQVKHVGLETSLDGPVSRKQRTQASPTSQQPPLSGIPGPGFGIESPPPSPVSASLHDPVYTAAWSSPIGPPPNAALPALPESVTYASSSGVQDYAASFSEGSDLFNGQDYGDGRHPFAYASASSQPNTAEMRPNGQKYFATRSSVLKTSNSRRGLGSSPPHLQSPSSSASTRTGVQAITQPGADPIHRGSDAMKTSSASTASTIHPSSGGTRDNGSQSRHGASRSSDSTVSKAPSSAAPARKSDHVPSKSVLTTALQQAQIAVSLDGEGNEEAAIEAYRDSVRLLKEVMARVAESSAQWRQKELLKLEAAKNKRRHRTKDGLASPNESSDGEVLPETEDEKRERLRREAKIEKREQMRLDEKAKLQTIHDTYEARIVVLEEEVAERRGAQLTAQEGSSRTRTTTSDRPRQSHDTARKHAAVTMLGSPIASPSDTSPSPRQSALPFPSSPPTHSRARSTDLHNATRLSSSPPPSLARPAEMQPLQFDTHEFDEMSDFAVTDGARLVGGRRLDLEQSVLSFSPDSENGFPQSMTEDQAKTHLRSVDAPISFASHHRISSNTSNGSTRSASRLRQSFAVPTSRPDDPSGINVDQHTYTSQEGSNAAPTSAHSTISHEDDETELDDIPTDLATPKLDGTTSVTFRQQSYASTISGHHRKSSAHASISSMVNSSDSSKSRTGSGVSTARSVLTPMTSSESSASYRPRAYSAAQPSSSGPAIGLLQPLNTEQKHTQDKMAEVKHTRQSSQSRQSQRRGASGTGRDLLVNASTAQGTIFQRRRSPQPSEDSHTNHTSPKSHATFPGLKRSQSSENLDRLTNAGTVLTANGADGSPNRAASLPMRHRALSQPNTRRPGLPSYDSDFVPPVPALTIPDSAPLMQRADSEPASAYQAQALFPPTPLSSAGQDYLSSGGPPTAASESTDYSSAPANFLEPVTPLTADFMVPQSSQASSHTIAGNSQAADYLAPPSNPSRRPFHLMRQLRETMQTGGYLTPRLYIPRQLWTQVGIKLLHTETKVRMLDLLLSGLEAIERAGEPVLAGNINLPASAKAEAAQRLLRELGSFEGMMDGVQSTLSKKLGSIEAPGAKKAGQNSLSSWGSKLSRSMDKMTKGRNMDAPETYVAAIARLCLHVQILDRHMQAISSDARHGQKQQHASGTSTDGQGGGRSSNKGSDPPLASGYAEVGVEVRRNIDLRLKRSSEFFGKIICQMILQDLGVWLDKYSKRAASWTTE